MLPSCCPLCASDHLHLAHFFCAGQTLINVSLVVILIVVFAVSFKSGEWWVRKPVVVDHRHHYTDDGMTKVAKAFV